MPDEARQGCLDGILDLDQDGIAEIALSADKEVLLLRGDSGTPIATLGTPGVSGHPFGRANAVGAGLDSAKPGLELLMIQTAGHGATEMGPPGFTAYHVDPRTGAWSLLWRAIASSYDAMTLSS